MAASQSLGSALAGAGAPLVLRRGSAAEIIPDVAQAVGATAVHAGTWWNPGPARRMRPCGPRCPVA